jgi:N-acyl homoserine lactone hydrolase
MLRKVTVWMRKSISQTTVSKQDWVKDDEEMLRASTRKLLALAQHEQVLLTIFGHDGEQWQTLKKVPDFYS